MSVVIFQVQRILPALLPAAFLLAACSKVEPPPELPRPVLTAVIGESVEDGTSAYSGEIRSRYETPLGFRIPGKIAARLVDTGARIKAGDVLARLDPADTALNSDAAEAQLALAEADARRYRELRTQNFVSQAALDARDAALKAARAQADLARNQSAYTVLRAEQAGVVAQVAAEVGQVVSAGQTVLRVARADAPEVAISIPESRIAGLRSGDEAEITLWADGETRYKGVLRELSAVADTTTRTYAARISIIAPDERIMLGMTAGVRFNAARGESKGYVAVPLTAIFQQDGKPALWIVAPDDSVALRPVDVLAYGETAATLRAGPRTGERIVVAGVHKLTAGEKIKVATAVQK